MFEYPILTLIQSGIWAFTTTVSSASASVVQPN